MDMPDVGIGVSYGALGLLTGLAATYLKARFASAKKLVTVEPDPLRVDVLKTYATKEELRELDERFERRLIAGLTTIREDILSLRRDIKENDEKAEARSSATHRRIDAMKDFCAMRSGGCGK
jgi:hypothetical protein